MRNFDIYNFPITFFKIKFQLKFKKKSVKLSSSNNNNGSVTLKKTKSVAGAKRQRVTKMVALVTLNFGVCWLPTHLISLLREFDSNFPYGENAQMYMYLLKLSAHTLTYITPVINPCLYAFYNENFRLPLSEILKLKTRK